MTCGALVRWSTGVQNSCDIGHVQHFQLPCILCLTIECAAADAIEKNQTEFLTTAQEMSIFYSTAHEEVATRRARQTDFRLAAALVRLFICLQRDVNSLTCGLSDFKSVCTWGTPEKTVPQPSIPSTAGPANAQPPPNMIDPDLALALSGSFRTEFPPSKLRSVRF